MVIRRLLCFHIILVELIVVLVILAILAAIMVPALTGWIDKAKEKQVVINARTAYLAAQTIASEKYATAADPTKITVSSQEIKDFVGTGEITGTIASVKVTSKGKVSDMKYTEGKKTVKLNGGKWDFMS